MTFPTSDHPITRRALMLGGGVASETKRWAEVVKNSGAQLE